MVPFLIIARENPTAGKPESQEAAIRDPRYEMFFMAPFFTKSNRPQIFGGPSFH